MPELTISELPLAPVSKRILVQSLSYRNHFIHMQILVHLHVNKTSFYMKGFALGLALKQRQKANQKLPILAILMSSEWIFSARIADTSLGELRRYTS